MTIDAHFHLVPSFKYFCSENVFSQKKNDEIFFEDLKNSFDNYSASVFKEIDKINLLPFQFLSNVKGCSCAHDKKEFLEMEKIILESGADIKSAFGIHPQFPVMENFDFLEELLKEKRICAIGETGFDFFTQEYRANKEKQIEAFIFCIEMAQKYEVPVIIHDRKALDILFKYSSELTKIKSVILHSFAFGPKEADSLLKKGINCMFSFGKPLLNGSRKALECIKYLPVDRLLFETDAPYQTLKGEKYTPLTDIGKIYDFASVVTGIDRSILENKIENNYINIFGS